MVRFLRNWKNYAAGETAVFSEEKEAFLTSGAGKKKIAVATETPVTLGVKERGMRKAGMRSMKSPAHGQMTTHEKETVSKLAGKGGPKGKRGGASTGQPSAG